MGIFGSTTFEIISVVNDAATVKVSCQGPPGGSNRAGVDVDGNGRVEASEGGYADLNSDVTITLNEGQTAATVWLKDSSCICYYQKRLDMDDFS